MARGEEGGGSGDIGAVKSNFQYTHTLAAHSTKVGVASTSDNF